jgi:hypothetical protein
MFKIKETKHHALSYKSEKEANGKNLTKTVFICCAGIFKQSMGARNRVGIGLPYRPARLHSLAELVPWSRFLGSLKLKNSGSAKPASPIFTGSAANLLYCPLLGASQPDPGRWELYLEGGGGEGGHKKIPNTEYSYKHKYCTIPCNRLDYRIMSYLLLMFSHPLTPVFLYTVQYM